MPNMRNYIEFKKMSTEVGYLLEGDIFVEWSYRDDKVDFTKRFKVLSSDEFVRCENLTDGGIFLKYANEEVVKI